MHSLVPLFLVAFAASAPALAFENVPVPAFHSIQLRGGGEVIVRPGPAQQVTIVEGSSQFTRIYSVRNGELRIDACNNRCPQHYRLRVEIRSPRMPVDSLLDHLIWPRRRPCSGGPRRGLHRPACGGCPGRFRCSQRRWAHFRASALEPHGSGQRRRRDCLFRPSRGDDGGARRRSRASRLLKLGDLYSITAELQPDRQQRAEGVVAAGPRVEGVEEQLRLPIEPRRDRGVSRRCPFGG